MTRVVILKSSLKIKSSLLILLMSIMNKIKGFEDGSAGKVLADLSKLEDLSSDSQSIGGKPRIETHRLPVMPALVK